MTTPQPSVQLYSVYKALDADLDGTLARLAGIGFANVEAFDFVRRAAELKTSLDRHGLAAPTGHAILIEEEVNTPDGILTVPPAEETFEAAAKLGIEIVIDPYLAPPRWADRDSILRSAERLNKRAEQAATFGLRVGYHNHDHELLSVIDGVTGLEIFAEQLDPAVALEVDLYWATASGRDPIALLTRLGDRVHALHIKDGPMAGGRSSANLPTDQTPAGQGMCRSATRSRRPPAPASRSSSSTTTRATSSRASPPASTTSRAPWRTHDEHQRTRRHRPHRRRHDQRPVPHQPCPVSGCAGRGSR
ncbi:sugar phosphate isomerase/epimerase family protein [Leifsonia poae]|uniref:sugar phosphate isomerase/epimerase family protein n=1 Tax=Leifsonia poae TaxID=110933 RepID=UPI003D6761C5